MKKLFIFLFFSALLWNTVIAQKTCTIEFYNLVQTNETELRFDARMMNTSTLPTTTNAFAINGIQLTAAFSNAILNGGKFSNGYYLLYLPGSSELVGQNIIPDMANIGVNANQNSWTWLTAPLAAGSGVANITTLFNHANWKKIGTFILKLRNVIDDGVTPSLPHNFASVTPNFTPTGGVSTTVTWCNYTLVSGVCKKKTGAQPTGAAAQVAVTIVNNFGNKALYSHSYSGGVWNANVDVTDASYNMLPLAGNSVSIGTLNNFDQDITQSDLGPVDGSLMLNNNLTIKDLIIESASTLTVNSGKQLSVDGTIYPINTAVDAITLKSDATGTASFKNSTAGITATIERFMPAWTATAGWHLLSSPVAGQAIAPNFIDPIPANYDFFAYDNSVLNCWKNQKVVSNGITTFDLGKGYLTSYFADGTHNFVGAMNVADVSPAVSYYSVAPATGFNLLGNPYACAIDGSLLTKTNVDNSVYVLDGPTNTYKYFNGVTGTFNGEIPSAQGFFVHANAAAPTITIPAIARKHTSNNFYKTALANQLKLNVQSPNATQDVAIIYFKNDNSNGVDANDALLMPAGNPLNTQIYAYINSDKYCIDALAEYSAPISVNVGFEPKVDGNFTITAGEIQSFSTASSIILQDLKTGTTQNLINNPTYNFTATTADVTNRFKILFDLAVGINNVNAVNNNIYSFENSIYIKTNDQVNSVSVYNMLGQEVANFQQPTSNVLTINQTSGYYTVRVITANNVYSQKVYIK
jgi:hypothetical protein